MESDCDKGYERPVPNEDRFRRESQEMRDALGQLIISKGYEDFLKRIPDGIPIRRRGRFYEIKD